MERPQQLQEARPRDLPALDLLRDEKALDDKNGVNLHLASNSASSATVVDRVPPLLHRRALDSFSRIDTSSVLSEAVGRASSARGRLRSRSVDPG